MSGELLVPRLLMQTWKNRKVPKKWKASPASIERHLPHWKYVLSTDEDNRKLVASEFPDFLSTYDSFPHPIQRADAVRYVWLWKHGGVYMDLDYEILKPLDELFREHTLRSEASVVKGEDEVDFPELFFVPSSNLVDYLTNSIMACSKPHHPFWLDVIEEMKKPPPDWAVTKHFEVVNTTGPAMLTRVASRRKHSYWRLPSAGLTPCSVCHIDVCDVSRSYLKQLQGGSWNDWDSQLLNFLLCNWPVVVAVLFLIVVVYLKTSSH